ncbi:MAG: DUF5131 family protein [Armatimonadia bacterium]|nr:DUF5131 family protein [Armatimonadia bacterium]
MVGGPGPGVVSGGHRRGLGPSDARAVRADVLGGQVMPYRGSRSGVPYADWSWNPVTGCTPISRACEHCWARGMLGRGLPGLGHDPDGPPVQVHPERLEAPRHWRSHRTVTVSFMGDWLHDDVPTPFIYECLSAMAAAPAGTRFLTLTKRPERLHRILDPMSGMREHLPIGEVRVLMERLWIGISVEDQVTMDHRLARLRVMEWPLTWISAEPLLERVDLLPAGPSEACEGLRRHVGWVVVGCERMGSNRVGRPFDPEWARALRDQCLAARADRGPRFYYKQGPSMHDPRIVEDLPELDGRQWTETPWERGAGVEC